MMCVFWTVIGLACIGAAITVWAVIRVLALSREFGTLDDVEGGHGEPDRRA